MSRQKLFIESLTDTERTTLEQGKKSSKSPELRSRCHAVLLSNQRIEVKQLAIIFSVGENTIRAWLNQWKKYGISGIIPKPGRGRKPVLCLENEVHTKTVTKAVKNTADYGTNALDEVNEKLDLKKPISKWTLNRFLKKKTMPTRDFVTAQKRSPKRTKSKSL